jgi:hypothetical protein
MAELFGVDIRGLVAANIGPGLLDVTVTRQAATTRDPDNLTGGYSVTPASFSGIKGIWESLPRTPPAGVEFELNDRIALLIGGTFPAGLKIARNDAITINGATLYAVQPIEEDPAEAAQKWLCRDRKGTDGA